MKEFLGQNQFVWWHGVVEDVADPLMLGRVRVRVYGYHSDDRIELPIASLPWAYPMQPITSAALSGIGTSPTGLLVGSHVFGFFRDGSEAQDPRGRQGQTTLQRSRLVESPEKYGRSFQVQHQLRHLLLDLFGPPTERG